jgi:putative IMPACT (imprinted ancient) family translation regulator
MHDEPSFQLSRASHRMWAVSLVPDAEADGDSASSSSTEPAAAVRVLSDDDGETGASNRLSMLLQRMGASNVLVLVTRRYGGVQLGNDRWKHILTVARQAVELVLAEQQQQHQSTSKQKGSKR